MATVLSGPFSVMSACGGPVRGLRAWLDSAPWLRPPGIADRCIMGSPVHPAVWCRRRGYKAALFCEHHGGKEWAWR